MVVIALNKFGMFTYDTSMFVYDTPYGLIHREGNGNPFWYSCLENPMDRGVWQATVHRVAKNGIQPGH